MPEIGSFGPIIFEALRSPGVVIREIEESYAEHEVAGAKGLLEWTGQKLSRVTLKLRFQAVSIGVFTCDPAEELSRIEELARKREPYPLFVGSRHMGKFVIEKVKETLRELDAHGNLAMAEVELTLKEYD